MNKAKCQPLLVAALVAALLTTTMAPAAIAAVPAAAAQQVTNASEVTALLPGGQFSKIWLAITPSNPGTVTVTAEWDRANALETGVGFYVLDENNLAAVVNGAPLPANNLGSGSSNFFLNGSSNMQGSSFNATGTAYTVVLFNDSNSDANVTLRVENGTISDDSGQVQDPNAAETTDEATPAAAEAATVEATAATTDTAVTTDTVAVAATPVATAAATPVATVVAGGPVRAETMQGSLPEQFSQHFLALEPSIRDGNINLVLTYDPQDSTELSRRINFWVLDTAGFQSYQDGESASAVAIAAGSRSFLDPDTSNKREASFQATGFGPYTVIVQNNSRVPATYQLAATGGVLVDDSAQTLTAQQASGVVSGTTTTTTTTTVATTTTTTDTAASTTAPATTGVVGTPGGSYTVVSGDTMAIIARDIYGDYRLYEQLCAFNNIADCNTIEVGQVINLPTQAEIGSVAAAPAAAATPVATVAAAPVTTTATTTTVTSTTPVTGTSAVTTTAAATRTAGLAATTATTRTGTAAASGTIVDLASESGDFTILLDALQQAELDAALAGSGPFTVFAPTDAAFNALLSGNNLTEDQLLAAKELADILQYHVLSGQLLAADMTNGSRATTLQGKPVTFEVRDGSVFVNGAELVTTDIIASNGVIHAIDAVILPPQS